MSNQVKTLILVVALAGAGFFFYRNLTSPSDSGVNMQETTYWVCHNESCKKDFEVPLAKVAAAAKEGGYVACTHCGQRKTSRAQKCPSCNRNLEMVGHGALPSVCPHCKENIGEASVHGYEPAAGKKTPTRKTGG
ncbi:MAG: hypothetical protein KJ057_00585 [Phycisphaerae bacterium]|nr:MAG: hypothetical protein EDS66_00130 [Planctomycetota bacterium]KAB2949237.1 MAG: hypothetical protein F9K17_03620 [Phycisphaerae bacterium]MBE7455697.1 hypothetical protein [Planctomycetia bacterium]MCK6463333.1 hypothetical protein [Phycisphaerae bacterium]MCL4716955.1 hypothetical protein [Phycisphaerae bacterium]